MKWDSEARTYPVNRLGYNKFLDWLHNFSFFELLNWETVAAIQEMTFEDEHL
jgi:hypothetical protein